MKKLRLKKLSALSGQCNNLHLNSHSRASTKSLFDYLQNCTAYYIKIKFYTIIVFVFVSAKKVILIKYTSKNGIQARQLVFI